jgi:hypothetical protein
MYQTLLAVVWLWYTCRVCPGWSVYDTKSKDKEKLMKANKAVAAIPMLIMSSQKLLVFIQNVQPADCDDNEKCDIQGHCFI